jgi:2-C-methyl-D-erythritol 2,4-cyclodiphosphate synthase
MMRIGHGYDVHQLVEGRDLVIGGVIIPHPKGLLGHSDADVLIHAICDACLGAAGLGDIGRHFPDSAAEYKDIDSRILLRRVCDALTAESWRVGNIDSTVIAQAPKLAPYLAQMTENIAADLGIRPSQVNIKATTTEKLGFAGREEGIAAHAVVLLERVVESSAG